MPDDDNLPLPEKSTISFQELAREAQETVYNPRPSGRCWLFHDFSMWENDASLTFQHRRCFRCGLSKTKRLQIKPHIHDWSLIRYGTLSQNEVVTGYFYVQKCIKCGEIRRVNV